MTRPRGMTLVACLLGLCAVGSIANALRQFEGVGPLTSPVTGALALAYAVAAGTAAVGLWRMAKWGLTALRAWIAVIYAMLAWFIVSPTHGSLPVPYFLGFGAFVTLVVFLLHGYVSRSLRAAA